MIGRVIGPGTAWLDSRRSGDNVDVLGPLGRSFSVPKNGRTAVLVSGGVGLPPIRWWGEILRKNGVFCVAVIGARQRDLLPISLCEEPSPTGEMTYSAAELARYGIPACIMTDDGSCGMRGQTLDGVARYWSGLPDPKALHVYMCGPEPMLHAIAIYCKERWIPCEAALERVMGCGMGTCQSCVVPIVDDPAAEVVRYVLCCRDGPVFDAAQVRW